MENSKETFKALFALPQDGFLDPIDLTDVEIGFSVYKVGLKKGFKSLFRIYVRSELMHSSSPEKLLTITAAYGKETDNGITTSSSEWERGRNWPVDIISDSEFSYNVETNQFFNLRKKVAIQGIQILQEVDTLHLKPTKPFLGFWLRTKLFWFQTIFTAALAFLFDVFSALQYLISGKQIHIFDDLSEPRNRVRPSQIEELKISRGKPIKIFEYEVEPWIAVLYCVFHFAIFAILYKNNIKPQWLISIFNNNFLTTMYGILSLGLVNAILPKILEPNTLFNPVLLFIQMLYYECAFKKLRV